MCTFLSKHRHHSLFFLPIYTCISQNIYLINDKICRSLQQIDFNSLSQNPLTCTCSGSQFLYAPCGHVVTGDPNIVRNEKLRDLLRKGPKVREPVLFSWHQNFNIIMDACEVYARQWAKKRGCRTQHSFRMD